MLPSHERVATGTASKTVVYAANGFVTHESPPLCVDCKEIMEPLVWICGCCGGVL